MTVDEVPHIVKEKIESYMDVEQYFKLVIKVAPVSCILEISPSIIISFAWKNCSEGVEEEETV